MPKSEQVPVSKLRLDLKNYRTVPQRSENAAIHALIALEPQRFWALMESLLEDGYHETENIIVLIEGKSYRVREGNRRVAAMKLILNQVKGEKINLPSHIQSKIKNLPNIWKTQNRVLPCVVYPAKDKAKVEKIVALTHAKGEKAARSPWNAVARARYNRDELNANEPGLDLLEKFLKEGTAITIVQAERWGGQYHLTVLDEVIQKVAERCGKKSTRELVDAYPNVKYRRQLDEMLRDIGLEQLDFKTIRGLPEFGEHYYNLPSLQPKKTTKKTSKKKASKKTAAKKKSKASVNKAVPSNDQRSVRAVLRSFTPLGKNREKLVLILEEARSLNLRDHPLSFCFLLRAMFELSAKAYCKDHRKELSAKKNDGTDKNLETLLREIEKHLTKNNSDKEVVKELHGSMAEIGNKKGFLSVTSLNQLIHHPSFAVDEHHICLVFHNLFPLLRAMNR